MSPNCESPGRRKLRRFHVLITASPRVRAGWSVRMTGFRLRAWTPEAPQVRILWRPPPYGGPACARIRLRDQRLLLSRVEFRKPAPGFSGHFKANPTLITIFKGLRLAGGQRHNDSICRPAIRPTSYGRTSSWSTTCWTLGIFPPSCSASAFCWRFLVLPVKVSIPFFAL